ncbi:hypothetical protein FM107_12180 [Sphingobacterium sp. JB170]|nr:hypothetical protein FM107_12180 [Sphingobacterium sp. JB170]
MIGKKDVLLCFDELFSFLGCFLEKYCSGFQVLAFVVKECLAFYLEIGFTFCYLCTTPRGRDGFEQQD